MQNKPIKVKTKHCISASYIGIVGALGSKLGEKDWKKPTPKSVDFKAKIRGFKPQNGQALIDNFSRLSPKIKPIDI